MELLKQVGDSEWVHIHETNKPLRITVQIPERLLGHAAYAIVRVHDGTAAFLPDLDSEPATITFETSLFSTYAIVYHDPEPTATPEPTGEPGTSPGPGDAPGSGGVPDTGDSADITLWALLLAASLAGLAAVLRRINKSV